MSVSSSASSSYAGPSTPSTGGPQARLPLAQSGPPRVSRRVLTWTAALVTLAYAALWSPWWYPLSDSSLYLVMARGLANGGGIGSLAEVHKSVRPLTPILLSLIIRCGGGIGAMHAVMIVLTLTAHLLCFITLRHWFNERVAFVATLATAVSWWIFTNAVTIMTEPLFLVTWWGGMAALSRIPAARGAGSQWGWMLLAIAGLVGAWYNRAAAVLLVPGVALGILFGLRQYAPLGRRVAWVALLAVVFFTVVFVYVRKAEIKGAEAGSVTADVGEAKPAKGERYKWNVLIGVDNPLIQLPVTGGRWMLESIAAAFNAPQAARSRAVRGAAGAFFVLVFVLMTIGGVRLLWRRRWWMMIAALYFVPFWVMWGTRVKPRYMAPVLPLLLVALWEGVAWGILRLSPAGGRDVARARASRIAAALLLLAGIGLNAIPYAIELYVRHAPGRNFYDVARRGGFAELVDIGAYLRDHADADDAIWENKGAYRRIVNYLSTHAPETISPEVVVRDADDKAQLSAFFRHVRRRGGRFAIVFFSGNTWPIFHWPIPSEADSRKAARWWQLYERNERDEFIPVAVPVSRDYVRDIPGVDGRGPK